MRALVNLKALLEIAEKNGFAVGAFSPRLSPLISPILRAGELLRSPVLVQVAQKELDWAGLSLSEFAGYFWDQYKVVDPQVPVGLHLDHTQDLAIIREALDNGFTSVMIDASDKDLDENIAITREVVAMAHARGVSVEAELGKIGTTDFAETDLDEELYTNPLEAARFVRETRVDALAVSVGTAHGVYKVRQPTLDLKRLAAIRALTPVHLVLHGGSGVPAAMIQQAIQLPGGGVSKVNIATDLEEALLGAFDLDHRLTDADLRKMSGDKIQTGQAAVQRVVEEKISWFLKSRGHAADYSG